MKSIVRVQKADSVSAKKRQPLVHGVVDAPVRFRPDPDLIARERIHDVQSAVGGAAVHHQHLFVRMTLSKERSDRVTYGPLRIQANGDDADFHACAAVSSGCKLPVRAMNMLP